MVVTAALDHGTLMAVECQMHLQSMHHFVDRVNSAANKDGIIVQWIVLPLGRTENTFCIAELPADRGSVVDEGWGLLDKPDAELLSDGNRYDHEFCDVDHAVAVAHEALFHCSVDIVAAPSLVATARV